MKLMLVILGNQFICEKRILNIVQKTIVMDEEEIETYIHNHHLFKDQRAISVNPETPVKSGYIFTGDAFVDPVNFTRIPIEGEVEEEEFEQEGAAGAGIDIAKWLENIMNEIKALRYGTIPIGSIEDTKACVNERMTKLQSTGSRFSRLLKPMVFKIKKRVSVYKRKPDTDPDILGYYDKDDIIVIEGFDPTFKHAFLYNNEGYVIMDIRDMYLIGGVDRFIISKDSSDKYVEVSTPDRAKKDKYKQSEMRYYDEYTSAVTEEAECAPVNSMENKEYTKQEKLQILIEEGYSVKKIAEEFDVNTSTIYKWLKKYNIQKGAN